MAEKQKFSRADFEQALINFGIDLIDDVRRGNMLNDGKIKTIELIIKMYQATATIPQKQEALKK